MSLNRGHTAQHVANKCKFLPISLSLLASGHLRQKNVTGKPVHLKGAPVSATQGCLRRYCHILSVGGHAPSSDDDPVMWDGADRPTTEDM